MNISHCWDDSRLRQLADDSVQLPKQPKITQTTNMKWLSHLVSPVSATFAEWEKFQGYCRYYFLIQKQHEFVTGQEFFMQTYDYLR